MATTSYGIGNATANEGDLLIVPRLYKADGTKRLVIYCHGAGANALAPLDAANRSGEYKLVDDIVRKTGFPVISTDMGGLFTWGNSSARTGVANAKAYGQGSLWGAKSGQIILVGGSMGACVAFNYAKDNLANVIAMVGVIPVTDLEDIRVNNRGGYKTSIEAAYGLNGSTSVAAADNPAQNTATKYGTTPYVAWYAADDAIVTASTVTAFASAIGGTAYNVGSVGHSNAAVLGVDTDVLAAFLLNYA